MREEDKGPRATEAEQREASSSDLNCGGCGRLMLGRGDGEGSVSYVLYPQQ